MPLQQRDGSPTIGSRGTPGPAMEQRFRLKDDAVLQDKDPVWRISSPTRVNGAGAGYAKLSKVTRSALVSDSARLGVTKYQGN